MSIQLTVNYLGKPSQSVVRAFDQAHVKIGRDPTNHLVLTDRRNVVSKYHAEIHCGEDFRVVDLGSKNFTYLNGQRLDHHLPASLKPGDLIRIGDFEIKFALATAVPRPLATSYVPSSSSASSIRDRYGSVVSAPLDTTPAGDTGLRRAVKELMLLNELSYEIGASLDSKAILNKIVHYSVRATQARQGLITMVDETQNMMETLIRQMDDSERLFHVNQSLLTWMDNHKQPIRLDRAYDSTNVDSILWDSDLKSLLCVPLLVRSRLMGILSVCNKRGATGFSEEDQRLLMIIAGQSAQIIETARLYEEEQRLHRIREEVRMAYEIQMNLLPKEMPRVEGYDIAGRSLPAETVGGDYFDFIPAQGHRLACCVGDVSGKGLPAALLMANVQATMRAQALHHTSAAVSLNAANTLLYHSTGKSSFVTLCYGLLHTHTHHFQYANAGHNRPLLLRPQSPPHRLTTAGLVLGFQPSWLYEEETIRLERGDLLVIFSDGITEAMNAQHVEFDEGRLIALLQQHRHESAEAIINHVFNAVEYHAGTYPQSDDMTLLLIRRL